MRERFEQRLFRIFAQAGYSPVQLLTVTPEEMVEIPGITVPNIRAVLCVQNKVLADRNKVRSGRLVEELLREAGKAGAAMSEQHLLDILAARHGCFISDLNLTPFLRRRPCPICAGWMRTATRCPNGRTRCATLPGMNGILPA